MGTGYGKYQDGKSQKQAYHFGLYQLIIYNVEDNETTIARKNMYAIFGILILYFLT